MKLGEALHEGGRVRPVAQDCAGFQEPTWIVRATARARGRNSKVAQAGTSKTPGRAVTALLTSATRLP